MKKSWKIKSSEGEVEFYPVFEVADDGKDVECKEIRINFDGKEHKFNFINIFQFIYFIANEELRRGLLQRYQRKVNYIPYEVTFKLSEDEIRDRMAKRRINLPVDELTVAFAKQEGWKTFLRKRPEFIDSAVKAFKGRNK